MKLLIYHIFIRYIIIIISSTFNFKEQILLTYISNYSINNKTG